MRFRSKTTQGGIFIRRTTVLCLPSNVVKWSKGIYQVAVRKVGNEFRVKSFWDAHVQKNMGRPGAEKQSVNFVEYIRYAEPMYAERVVIETHYLMSKMQQKRRSDDHVPRSGQIAHRVLSARGDSKENLCNWGN